LWEVRGDGGVGIGMPQQQFIAGGDFATALSVMAADKLREVRRELREVDREITLVTPDSRNVPLSAQQGARESGAVRLLGASSAESPVVPPLLRTMGFSPGGQGAGPLPQPAPAGGDVLPSSPTAVVPLSALTAGLLQQRVVAQNPANQAAGVSESELAQLTASRVLGLAEVGVPNSCIVALSEQGVNAGNMADLPWGVLVDIVSGGIAVGVTQITLLQALHTRLQRAREARSNKSDSRSNSRASSRAGSRSGVSGIGVGSVLPHGAQPVAQGMQQQQVTAGPATVDLGLRFAAAGASVDTACTRWYRRGSILSR
jgi:hypothetical protein